MRPFTVTNTRDQRRYSVIAHNANCAKETMKLHLKVPLYALRVFFIDGEEVPEFMTAM